MKIKAIFLVFLILFTGIFPVKAATNEGYGEDSEALGQFVDSFEDMTGIAVNVSVERNVTLNAMELNYTSDGNLSEDFDIYVHTDPQNKVIPDGFNISWVNYERDDSGRTVFDFGVNQIVNFNWFFEFKLSDLDAGDTDRRGFLFVLAMDQTDSVGFAPDHYTQIQLVQVAGDDTIYNFWMTTKDGVSTTEQGDANLDVGTIYYCNYFRDGQNKTLNVFTDSARTNEVEHLSHNAGTNDYRYIQVIKQITGGADPSDDSSGYMFELYNNSKGVEGYESEGYFSTVDYLSDPLANGSALVHMSNTTMPANTAITLEFSEDNITWTFNDWQPIFGGFESVDLRDLNYSTGYYVRHNLSTTDPSVTPRVYQSRLITTQGNPTVITINQTINLVNGTWKYHNVSAISVTIGTHDSGDLNSTLDIDGDTYNCSEVVGAPGYRISFNFTDVNSTAGCLWVVAYVYYDGNLAHDIHVELYNHTASAWVEIDVIDDDVAFEWHNSSIYELRIPSEFIDDSGSVFGRFDHVTAGNINHDIYIEYLKLHAFIPTGLAAAGATEEPFQLFWIAIAIALMMLAILIAKMWFEQGDP